MRFVAVTACPTGVAHTLMAAEALKRQAEVMGHEIAVETQGSVGTESTLTADQIAAADGVIVAADIHVDMTRFEGKPMRAVSTSEAIRHTETVLADLAADVEQASGGTVIPAGTPDAAPTVVSDAVPDGVSDGAPAGSRKLVGITSCPTGIAHTFMAAAGLQSAADELGYEMKVETQGSVGAQNTLSAADIADAEAVVIAADTKVDLSRFEGKTVYETGTNDAIKRGSQVVERALELAAAAPGTARTTTAGAATAGSGAGGGGAGGLATASPTAGGGGDDNGVTVLRDIYQHLMTGVSYMLPLVVAGGLMIALSFAFDIDANDAANAETFAGRLYLIGSAGLTLFLPVFAAFIVYSIADRPGLAPGFIGGYLATQVDAGFLGALLAGFLAGYLTLWLARTIKLPDSLAGLMPVLILPLLSTLVVGLAMYYVIGEPISWVQDQLTDWLTDMQGSNAAVLGLILGAMMATDMGGPLNKVAYTFAVGLVTASPAVPEPMAAVMVAGMTPPLALALATVLFPSRWTAEEREAGKPAWALGLSFITEGAIPFAARDPLRVIPALVAGSAVAGAISMGFGASTVVPHGGIFDLFVPGAVKEPLFWLLALLVGTLVSTAVLFFLKKPQAVESEAPLTADAVVAPA